MKYVYVIPVALFSIITTNAFGAYSCKPISGSIEQLAVDPVCKILKDKAVHFPDVTFYGVLGSCFSGKLQGTLGGKPVTGISSSGLTVNGIGKLTSASTIRVYSGSNELGRLFTKDLLSDPEGNTSEFVSVVDGSKQFKGGHGSLEIIGNGLYQATSFSGVICTED